MVESSSTNSHPVLKAVAFTWDGFGTCLLLLVVFALMRGRLKLDGRLISAIEPAGVMLLLWWPRLFLLPRVNLFGLAPYSPQALESRITVYRHRWAACNLKAQPATAIVLSLSAAALTAKLLNAWFYFGFFSGDDVEALEFALAQVLEWSNYIPWGLRNPLYPTVFLRPAIEVAQALGFQDPQVLVFSARLVVAVISTATVPIAFLVGQRLTGSHLAGVFAAGATAVSGAFTRFSSSALPRPIAGTLILLALLLLLRAYSRRRLTGAAASLGLAAALRFSEFIALPAAVFHLWLKRQRKQALVLGGGVATVALALLFLADGLYASDPFRSSEAIVRYTLLEGASSRGYQPAWEYLRLLLVGVGPVITLGCLFFFWGFAEQRLLLFWVVVPVGLLSLLSHKELRYLVPYIPLLTTLAGLGAWRVTTSPTVWPQHGRLLLVFLFLFVVFQVNGMRFPRSEDAVRAARAVESLPGCEQVAFEQSWRAGGRIYLPSSLRLLDLDVHRIGDWSIVEPAASDPKTCFIGLRAWSVNSFGYADTLRQLGFEEVPMGPRHTSMYRLFRRTSE
jgi:hypothetical protein